MLGNSGVLRTAESPCKLIMGSRQFRALSGWGAREVLPVWSQLCITAQPASCIEEEKTGSQSDSGPETLK